ncbi:serine/threonine-protein kinase, partial [Corynebacterium bovis]
MVNAGPPDDLGDLTPVLDEVARSRGLTRFEEIGRGGMGVVVKAWDDITARWVAVKIFSRHGVGRDMGLQRFRKEIRLLASIHHPAIISVYYAGKAGDDVAYFVMEYVDGPNLATLISRRQEEGRPFTVDETVTLLRPVAAALDHLHSLTPPVFHRDIKPANIIVRPVRDGVDAGVLTDFGISLSAEDTRVTSEGMVVGTDHYLAPELFSSDPDTGTRPDRASDIYAFAAVVAEMLTLRTVKSTMSEPAWRFARGVPTYRAGDLAPEDAGRVAVVNRAVADALHPDPS